MIKLIGIFLIMSLIIPSIIYAEIYKWVNDDGSIGFTDDLSKVPERYRDQVEIKKYRINSSQKDEDGERTAKSNQSTQKEDLVEREYQKQEELSPEEKDELEKKLRGIWDDMKKSLKGR